MDADTTTAGDLDRWADDGGRAERVLLGCGMLALCFVMLYTVALWCVRGVDRLLLALR